MQINSIADHANQIVKKPDPQQSEQQQIDPVSQNLQNKLSDVQRQKQELSSKSNLSEEERMKKRQELQQEISSLNTQLRQRQEEIRREQKKDSGEKNMQDVSGEEQKRVKQNPMQELVRPVLNQATTDEKDSRINEENKEAAGNKNAVKQEKDKEDGMDAEKEAHAGARPEMEYVMTASYALENAEEQNAIMNKVENDMAVTAGEIRQDRNRGMDVDDRQERLKQQKDRMLDMASGMYTSKHQGQLKVSGIEQEARKKAYENDHSKFTITYPNV